jgi:hypothetical protein
MNLLMLFLLSSKARKNISSIEKQEKQPFVKILRCALSKLGFFTNNDDTCV